MSKPGGDSASSNSASGVYAPLKVPIFRAFWLASFGSNIGTWINVVTSGWVMTDLSPSPVMVSLVQAADFVADGAVRAGCRCAYRHCRSPALFARNANMDGGLRGNAGFSRRHRSA